MIYRAIYDATRIADAMKGMLAAQCFCSVTCHAEEAASLRYRCNTVFFSRPVTARHDACPSEIPRDNIVIHEESYLRSFSDAAS